MAIGDIAAALTDSLTISNTAYYPNTIRIPQSTDKFVIAVDQVGAGKAYTFQCDDAGNIGAATIANYQFDVVGGFIVHVSGDVFAIFTGPTIYTKHINSNGTFGADIANLGIGAFAAHVPPVRCPNWTGSGKLYAIPGQVGFDLAVKTIRISDDGATISVLSTSTWIVGANLQMFIRWYTGNIYLTGHSSLVVDSRAKTFSIHPTTGVITQIGTLTLGTALGSPYIQGIWLGNQGDSSDVCAFAAIKPGVRGCIYTTVHVDQVTGAFGAVVASLNSPSDDGDVTPYQMEKFWDTIYIRTHVTGGNLLELMTIRITKDGTARAYVDGFIFGANPSFYPNFCPVSKQVYLLSYQRPPTQDGVVSSILIVPPGAKQVHAMG